MATYPKDWRLFESEVTQLVEAFGYRAETTQPSHDYGVDVIGYNRQRKVILQCKLYGKGRIGGDTILKLIGSRSLFGATDAICITTSSFTKQACEIANQQNVLLLDSEKLILLCRERNLTIPSLTILRTSAGQVIETQRPSISFGRASDNDVILGDGHVSRHHASLERNGLRLILNNCNSSTNGTFVNIEKITSPVCLNYGNEVGIGQTVFQVCMRLGTGATLF